MSTPIGFPVAHDALNAALADDRAWNRIAARVIVDRLVPGATVRQFGDAATDVLIVESGLLEIAMPDRAPRWALPGAIIGLSTSLIGANAPCTVTATRHSTVVRIPAHALLNDHGASRGTVAEVAAIARSVDGPFRELPPDPLVVAILLESLDAQTAQRMSLLLNEAARALPRTIVVHVGREAPGSHGDLADELAAHEVDAGTVVYVVHGGDGERAAAIVAHADRVIIVQLFGRTTIPFLARTRALDPSAGRRTELVYVNSDDEQASRSTEPLALPPDVSHVHLLPDLSASRLAILLADVRRSAREHETLRDFALFADLDGAELAWLQTALVWQRVDGGSVLIREGDDADALFLVRAGRLQVLRETSAGQRHVSWVGTGESVGEDGLLTAGRRACSVRAVRDSTVARLDRNTIVSLLDRSITFARALARALAAQVSGHAVASHRRARTFAVLPLTDPARMRGLADSLADAMRAEGRNPTLVDAERVDRTLGKHAARTRRGDVGETVLIEWLDQLEREHDAVLLLCGAEADSWSRRAIRQSDHVLLVADATSAPTRRPIELSLFGDPTQRGEFSLDDTNGGRRRHHLILLQRETISEAHGTAAWLIERPQHTHHHVRDAHDADVARVARRITGRAVALALSGASSRAPAHLGAVRALDEHRLPVDIVSGSSSGAGVAALVACGYTSQQALPLLERIVQECSPRMQQLQPPLTAFTSGAAADRALQSAFGSRMLEDQLIPAVITAVDIRRHRLVQLTRGPIWKLVRASGSLPLLWPPVWHEGDLLVDGGIISYLPVEVFGDETEAGLIIASNLDPTAGQGAPAFEASLDYGSTFNAWEELVRRIGGRKRARPPAIIDILFHAMAIPSFQQQEGLNALARQENMCVLTPPLDAFGLFDVTRDIGRALESTSYEHARAALSDVAARWRASRAISVSAANRLGFQLNFDVDQSTRTKAR
ncbi:MAG: cyclic nucleotide-binding domain-containing protein [Gemmatimonadaceae bacterium]|nr:cyclic nucleotide-binding domain-containing protein [Gemmatimonadaceae bacterium]